MEVLDPCSALLSNKEVLDLLKSNIGIKQTNLATILYETTSYLESTPTASCSLSGMAKFLDTLKERNYDLSKIEKIQLVNLKPQNETELHLIVDNIEEKFSEDQRNDLLQLLQTTLSESDDERENTKCKKIKQ